MNTANPYRFLPLAVISLVLMTAVPLRAQQPPLPKSGALIGLSSGQTLWIAPMDGNSEQGLYSSEERWLLVHRRSDLPAAK